MLLPELPKNQAHLVAEALNELSTYHDLSPGDRFLIAEALIMFLSSESEEFQAGIEPSDNVDIAQDILKKVTEHYAQVPPNLTQKVFSRPLRKIRAALAISKAEREYRGIWQPTELHQQMQLLILYMALGVGIKLGSIGLGLAILMSPPEEFSALQPVICVYLLSALSSMPTEIYSLKNAGYAVNPMSSSMNLTLNSEASTVLLRTPTLLANLFLISRIWDSTGSPAHQAAFAGYLGALSAWHIGLDGLLNLYHVRRKRRKNKPAENTILKEFHH